MGTWFRHERSAEDSSLPDGVTSAGSAHEEVVLALRHYDVGALHGGQLSCVGGVSGRWGLETGRHKPKYEHRGSTYSEV